MDTNPKPFVFVLMPFAKEFNNTYQLGIKSACEGAGAYCERVDEQFYDGDIIQRVYNQIAKADIIVADMTGRNPNVFYETGYAHALNKRVVLLTQNVKDIPFDLQHYSHVVYDGNDIVDLKKQLETRIRWSIENPQKSLTSVDIDLEFIINNVPLFDYPGVKVQLTEYEEERFSRTRVRREGSLIVSIHNKTSKVIDHESFDFALVLPDLYVIDDRNYSTHYNGCYVWNFQLTKRLFPDAWDSLTINLVSHTTIPSPLTKS